MLKLIYILVCEYHQIKLTVVEQSSLTRRLLQKVPNLLGKFRLFPEMSQTVRYFQYLVISHLGKELQIIIPYQQRGLIKMYT